MAEESFCVKKNTIGNPSRLSLRRSRFYAQNMNESLVTSEKPQKKALLVSHVRRPSNIPSHMIRETFKLMGPIKNESGTNPKDTVNPPKDSVTANKSQLPGFRLPIAVSNKSRTLKDRNNPEKSETKGEFKRPLTLFPRRAIGTSSLTKTAEKRLGPIDEGLEYPKALHQSTPYEARRGILKPGDAPCDASSVAEKSKAAKRVIFDGDGDDKENEEKPLAKSLPLSDEDEDDDDDDEGGSPLANGVMDLWKAYWADMDGVRAQIRSAEDKFRRALDSGTGDSIREAVSAFVSENRVLCKRFNTLRKDAEKKLMTQGNNVDDLRVAFLKYVLERETIFREQSQLEKKFELGLETLLRKRGESEDKAKRGKVEKLRRVSGESKNIRRSLGSKRKTPKRGGSNKRAARCGDEEGTELEALSYLRNLSKDIDRQINTLLNE